MSTQPLPKEEPPVSGAGSWQENKGLSNLLSVYPEALKLLPEGVIFFHLVPFIL